ncbi:MAG: hypothetical protein AB8B83_08250 [Bdellovibrionales bacterium]
MNQIINADSHALLSCFFQECESQFRFLEETHGFLYLSGLAEYQSHYKIIKPYSNQLKDTPYPFYAITRYERDNQAVEIFYGDHNYALEVFIYPDSMRRLNLQDIVSAIRQETSGNKNLSYLTEEQNISHSLEWFSKIIESNPKILNPNEKLIKKTETMRERLLEQSVRSHLEALVTKASARAAKAFTRKDYSLVVEILSLYKDFLNRSDLKKLQIAQEKLS